MDSLAQLLKNAGGLEHVEQKALPIPLSGGRAGDAMRTNLLAMIHGAKTSIIASGIDPKVFDGVVDSLSQEWQACQTSYQFHAAYGQRKSHKTLLSAAGQSLEKRELNVRNSQLPNAQMVHQFSECHA
jgi:hypothetical protein